MNYSIGIDIGATKIMFVLLKDKKVTKKKKVPTPKNRKDLIKVLKENLKDFPKTKKIGLAVAGVLDLKKGLVLESPNIKYLNNFALVRTLEKELKIKVLIENDANCFTLAEAVLGAGKNKKIVLGVTLGSGLGGGIVINSEIYHGAFGTAGEIGHQTIKFSGEKCSCGNQGCFELYGSAKFFKRKGYSAQELAKKAKLKDKKALKIFQEYGKFLGIGLSDPINIIDPEVIVIGGGISKAYPYFLKETKKEIEKRIISSISKKHIDLKISNLGETAGAIGAVLI